MDVEIIAEDADIVCARRSVIGRFRFECWGERDGRRLPGTVFVTDLMMLDRELAMAGLETIPTFALDSVLRDRSRPGVVYVASVISVY